MDRMDRVSPHLVTELQETVKCFMENVRKLMEKLMKAKQTCSDLTAAKIGQQNDIRFEKSIVKMHEDAVRALTAENCKLREKVTEQSREVSELHSENQWSPLNQEGKKAYKRDFLMSLCHHPLSKRPDNLPDLEEILNYSTSQCSVVERTSMNSTLPVRSSRNLFVPSFMRTPPTSCEFYSQQPAAKGGWRLGESEGNKPVMHIITLKEEVQLHKTENAWKPGRMKPPTTNEQEAKTEELYKKVRAILNKLTPQKFRTLVKQIQTLPIDSADQLKGVVNLIFEKVIDEPHFCEIYAQMCKDLSNIRVPHSEDAGLTFRNMLLTRCQVEFYKNSEVKLNRETRLKEIQQITDPAQKKRLQLDFKEEDRRIRMKSVGNVRLIGELYKLRMMVMKTMHECIRHLISEGDEQSLECLCELLTTVGYDLENRNQDLTEYFKKMKERSQERGVISSRIRFMIQDVIDLRQGRWILRRNDSAPKTIDQIRKEAEQGVGISNYC